MANFIEEPQPGSPPSPESDPEACIPHVDYDEPLSDGTSTPSSSHTVRPEDSLLDNSQWDDDITTPTQNLNSYQWNNPVITLTRPSGLSVSPERTPLIRKATSFHVQTVKGGYGSIEGKKKSKTRTKPPRKIRTPEPTQKAQEFVAMKTQQYPPGRSTFGQTVSQTHSGSYLICALSTFSNSSYSTRSLYSLVLGCCRSPSPSPTLGGVAAPCCSFSMGC